MKGRTRILVTNQLHRLKNADHIILERWKDCSAGNYEDILKSNVIDLETSNGGSSAAATDEEGETLSSVSPNDTGTHQPQMSIIRTQKRRKLPGMMMILVTEKQMHRKCA